jgi:hypothetical protein
MLKKRDPGSSDIRLASLMRDPAEGAAAPAAPQTAAPQTAAPQRDRRADWRPQIPQMNDPYPAGFSSVRYLAQESDLMIARPRLRLRPDEDRETEYVLARDFTVLFDVDGRPWRVTAPAGMLTDLATSKWFTRPVLGRVGPHLEAAILHDYLCIAWQDLSGDAARNQPRPGDFEFSSAAMMAMLESAGLHPVVTWGVRKVINSDTGRARFDDPNPAPRYVTVPRGGDWPD